MANYAVGRHGLFLRSLFFLLLAFGFSLTFPMPVFATGLNPDQILTPNPSPNTSPSERNPTPNTSPSNLSPSTPGVSIEKTDEKSEKPATCYDQVNGLGWLVCPGAGLLANVIDGAYRILSQLMFVRPISMSKGSPARAVWDYMRSITNIVFVILFLVIIYSHLTGLGINNYNIKRMLPRLVIASILVNFSFIICLVAVDVSNIIGLNLNRFFSQIINQALSSGQISASAANASVSTIVSIVLGIGVAGAAGVIALTHAGGLAGLIWLLLPIIFAGAIAVVSAVLTMAARQAIIFLLILISPLAFVAYLLPNTEKWFKRWYSLFFAMLVFFPVFSLLYSCSRLAGLLIISSSTDPLSTILGIGVQILPLFLSIPLMRLSGTVLGSISGMMNRLSAPAYRSVKNRAILEQSAAKQRQLLDYKSRRPSTRLARWLEQGKYNRAFDLDNLADTKDSAYKTRAATSLFDKRGQLTRRGLNYQRLRTENLENVVKNINFKNDFDEGFKTDGSDRRIRPSDYAELNSLNQRLGSASVAKRIAETRTRVVATHSANSKADKIRAAAPDPNSDIHKLITSSFRYANQSQNGAEQQRIDTAVNTVLADAITMKRHADLESYNNYIELFRDTPSGPIIGQNLEKSFQTKDYNALTAAVAVMAERGDYDSASEILRQSSRAIVDSPIMQKQLNDALITMKKDNVLLWSWAKANLMRNAMHGNGKDIAPFIDFDTFLRGGRMQNDHDNNIVQKTSMLSILNSASPASLAISQDRTLWTYLLDLQNKHGVVVPISDSNGQPYLPTNVPLDYIKNAALSGQVSGEKLEAMNNLLVGGFKLGQASQNNAFELNKAFIADNILTFFKDMTASELVNLDPSTLELMNSTMDYIHPEQTIVNTYGEHVNSAIYQAVANARETLNQSSATTTRSRMSQTVGRLLGVKLS